MLSRINQSFGKKQPGRYSLRKSSRLQTTSLMSLVTTLSGSFAMANNHSLFGSQPVTIVAPTTYQVVVPTNYTVISPVISHSYVLSPTVQLLPANWLTTTSYLPGPCTGQSTVSPALEPTRVPELQDLPATDKEKSSEPAEKPQVVSSPKEPNLDNPGASNKPETDVKTTTKKSGSASPPKAAEKASESSPPLAPEVKAPGTALPKPSGSESSAPTLPPEKPALKPVDSPLPPAVELPKSLSDKPESLVPPPAAELPRSEPSVPPLSPAESIPKPEHKPTSGKSTGPNEKPPVVENGKASDLPPVENLPKLPETQSKSNLPSIPLPEIPPPADDLGPIPPATATNLPVPELPEENDRNTIDPSAIKSGNEEKKISSPVKRDSFKPVLTSKFELPKLALSVRDKSTGTMEQNVSVIFREPGSSQIKFRATTDPSGKSSVEVPEGRWEVMVETKSGPLFVLGELISKSGKVTTVKGRELPTLEINR